MKKQWLLYMTWIAVLTIILTGVTPQAADAAAEASDVCAPGGAFDPLPSQAAHEPALCPETARQVYTLQELADAIAAAPYDASEGWETCDIEIMADIKLDEGAIYIDYGQNIRLWSAAPRTLRAVSGASHFIVRGFLTLENDVMLKGSSTQFLSGGVQVGGGGAFTMYGGKISGCAAYDGSAVYVMSGSWFVMDGGRISGNKADRYGSVHVEGQFRMYGGEISRNTASDGGGVYVSAGGEFEMNGGKISQNTGKGYNGTGGVHVDGADTSVGEFTMNDGEISQNMNSGIYIGGSFVMNGGYIKDNTGIGVYISPGGSFQAYHARGSRFGMNGGQITGNGSGGVHVSEGSAFTMNGGEIRGNRTSRDGGGVYVAGLFNMNGGMIIHNAAYGEDGTYGTHYGQGGGVYVGHADGGIFRMRGGEISGNTAAAGGGVHVAYSSSIFLMLGGRIKSNAAITGASVYVAEEGVVRIPYSDDVYISEYDDGVYSGVYDESEHDKSKKIQGLMPLRDGYEAAGIVIGIALLCAVLLCVVLLSVVAIMFVLGSRITKTIIRNKKGRRA